MKHRDYFEDYNEIMYNERDVIEHFLSKHGTIADGNKMYDWHFDNPPTVMLYSGIWGQILDLKLDLNCFILYNFRYDDGTTEWLESFHIAYGQLSTIIDALPELEDVQRTNRERELKRIHRDYNVGFILEDFPFEFKDGEIDYTAVGMCDDDNHISVEVFDGESYGFIVPDNKTLQDFYTHIKLSIMKRSNQYRTIKEYVNNDNKIPQGITITPSGTDLKLPLKDIFFNGGDMIFNRGDMILTVDVSGTSLVNLYGQDTITLDELDLDPYDLEPIVEYIDKLSYFNIMGTENNHNPELVRKINAAWKNTKYHDRFGDILFALGCRDKQEIMDKFDVIIDCNETAMDNAHEIMGYVCDDWDLDTILSFIRYEE